MFIKKFLALVSVTILLFFFQNCTGGLKPTDFSSTGIGYEAGFRCENPNKSSQSSSMPLSKLQYSNTIKDIFGQDVYNGVSSLINTLPNASHDQNKYQRTSTITSLKISLYNNLANKIADLVVTNKSKRKLFFGKCANDIINKGQNLTKACVNNFLTGEAVKIWRRPPTTSEKNFIYQITNANGTVKEKLRAILSYPLQSPYFLWRVELGDGSASNPNLNLTAYETATRLAYTLTDSTPDQELLDAAKNGNLQTHAQLYQQALRLVRSPHGKEKTVASVMQWANASNPQGLNSLTPKATEGLNTRGLEEAMVNEAERFLEYVIFNEDGSFEDILTSKKSFAKNTSLAQIYAHKPLAKGQTFTKFTQRRQGLLMRAPFFLTDRTRTQIIKRGVDFQQRILCNPIPSPTVDIADNRNKDAFSDAEELENPNRLNVKHKTRSQTCMGCHSSINPTGFAFENIDSIGRIRKQEVVYDKNKIHKYVGIDTSAEVPTPISGFVNVKDSYDLVGFVAKSTDGKSCFLRNMYRFINEKLESNADNCLLKDSFAKLSQKDTPLVEVFAQLAVSKNLTKKTGY